MVTSPPMSAAAAVAVFVLLFALPDLSAAVVYKVGDAAGWTILGSPNYTAWAVSKTFLPGDVIVFEYNKQFHNVMRVSREDYRSCNAGSPLATFTSGNDTIPIAGHGHHYFLCGVPGHCAAGQKVDIRVPKVATSAAPSVVPASAPAASAASAPAPTTNDALAARFEGTSLILSVIVTMAASMIFMSSWSS